jgi:hypothetical protein
MVLFQCSLGYVTMRSLSWWRMGLLLTMTGMCLRNWSKRRMLEQVGWKTRSKKLVEKWPTGIKE